MPAYYNENNAFAAAWLRELIKAKLIADGDVDDRSIKEVQPADIKDYTQCHFFAGIGVWRYSLRNAGFPDNRKVWTGSCPCQPFSAAGKKGGFDDERHLWPDWFRLIRECKPDTIFGEQVASKAGLAWFDLVSTDLEGSNYTVGAADLCAAGVGAPHIRQRLYFCASNTNRPRLPLWHESGKLRAPEITSAWSEFERVHATSTWKEREIESRVPVFADGDSNRVGKIRGYGNSLVAPVAQTFIESFLEMERDAI